MTSIQPNLFIPGAAKSGTTTLHELLDMHPDICMSLIKEPVFWNNSDYEHPERIQWYNNLFTDKSAKILGESTTSYMYFPEFIPRIKTHFEKNPKFIFILRNPIDRCYSHYWWMVGRKQESRSFRESMTSDMSRNFEKYDYVPNYYFHFGLYYKWLKDFFNAFGKASIKIITLEQLQANQLNTLNNCFTFLDLQVMQTMPEIVANKTERLKYPKLFHFIKKTTSGKYRFTKIAKYFISRRKIDAIKQRLRNSDIFEGSEFFDYPPMLSDDRKWLKNLYQEDVKALKQLSGIAFEEWTDFKN